MTLARMELPASAAALLRRTHAILDAHLTPHTPGGEGWRLGGGTVLAARWRHRDSDGLDVQVHARTERAYLGRERNPALWRKLYAAGATHIDFEAAPAIKFGREGRIELLEARPIPRLGHERTVVDGAEVTVLVPAQILTGKLVRRGVSPPVRDLYDLAVAQRVDPEAAAVAVNALSAHTAAAAAAWWTAGEAGYRREGQREIRGVPEAYRLLSGNPACAAREALRDARYRALELAVSVDRAVVCLESRKLALKLVYDTPDAARAGFEQSGVNLALQSLGVSSGRVRDEVDDAFERGENRSIHAYYGDSVLRGSGQDRPDG